MSSLETHEAEQAEITARCEAGTCEHLHCREEFEIVSRAAPRWAWDIIDETLGMDACSKAFDAGLRESIRKAHAAMVLASELADDEPISDEDPRLNEEDAL